MLDPGRFRSSRQVQMPFAHLSGRVAFMRCSFRALSRLTFGLILAACPVWSPVRQRSPSMHSVPPEPMCWHHRSLTATCRGKHAMRIVRRRAAPSACDRVAVFFQGGSWNGGERAVDKSVAAALAFRGVLTLAAPSQGDRELFANCRASGEFLSFKLEQATPVQC